MQQFSDHKNLHSDLWAAAVTQYLAKQRKLRCLKYRDISQRLKEQFDLEINERNLSRRFNSGRLGAQLFVTSLIVMGVEQVAMKEILKLYNAELQAQADADTE